jgi:hypothetical protein
MRILLDSNIFIYREDYRVISQDLIDLLKILAEINAELVIHPLSLDEIKGDRNIERREIVLSKIRTYPELGLPPDPEQDPTFLTKISSKRNSHDRIDNALLYAVVKDAIDFLITEDREIINKAIEIGIDNRVFSIGDACIYFRGYALKEETYHPPAIRDDYVYNLNPNDPIFDVLKLEYGKEQFERWLSKISREARKCWVYHRDDGTIGALLIYKLEDEAIGSIPPIPKNRRIKISTFIVKHIGQKIGELFIKMITDFAVRNNIPEIYLTHYIRGKDPLVDLTTEYGFKNIATKIDGEAIFLKKLLVGSEDISHLTPIEIAKIYYPSFYDGDGVDKFIIPIRPEFHQRLFIEFLDRQTTLPEHIGGFIIEGNTIKKAYLCHSKSRKLKTGDIVLFYQSRKLRSLTTLGIVETIHQNIRTIDEIIRIVGKRTAYPREELERMKKPLTIILFRYHFHFETPLSHTRLKEWGVITFAPQSITQITDEKYNRVKREGGIDERYTVH